jgi:SAM-dependent methyltransferase
MVLPMQGTMPMEVTYQTHHDKQKGMSDSVAKLMRLKIPEDLTGRSFLDIGCNEGYFCNVAARRGASRVVGIDFHPPSLDFARTHYSHPVIEYRLQRWEYLPDEHFDVVLWSSSMHYERDPVHVFRNIARILHPKGLFILECGVASGGGTEMVLVQRHSDSRWYPTANLLTSRLLTQYAFREVSSGKVEPGDPVPRHVYHCLLSLPTVLLFRGQTGHGKSSAARLFGVQATKNISLDHFVYRISAGKFHHGGLQLLIKEKFNADDLTALYESIDKVGLTDEYVRLLAGAIAPSDISVVIDGYMTDRQADALGRALNGRAIMWDARRLAPIEG